MTIRRLLFALLLYILLVGGVAYLSNPDDWKQLIHVWLLWTVFGIGVLLLFVILERAVEWSRVRRAERKEQPTASALKGAVHEDDAALAGLLREADERLAQAPVSPGARALRASDLPLHLIVGPERSGKTSVVQNCGVEFSLLAGQVLGGESIVPTQVANLWLGNDSLFCEVGGRIFNTEPERFAKFLSVLQSGGSASGWRAFKRGGDLKSVLLVCDARAFAGTPDQSALSRSAQQIRERLSAIATVFGAAFPVYVLFTNLDGTVRSEGLPYFSQFFARLGESEAGQVLGVLSPENSPSQQNRVWAEVETKRLTKLFQSVLVRLGDRRLLALAQETEPSRKPGIYEFPREFRKIRAPLLQFLVDVFKPDPLKAMPWMRGFFFTGTRKAERPESPSAEMPSVYASPRSQAEATRIFSPKRHGSTAYEMSVFSRGATGQIVDRWMFLTELFHTVLGFDQPTVRRMAPAAKFERYRRFAIGAAAGCAVFLALVWTASLITNLSRISEVEGAIKAVRTGSTDLSSANLAALEDLKKQLEQLHRHDSWIPHWGLYVGDRLEEDGLRVYFDRLKKLSLMGINKTLVQHLRKQDAQGMYERLKAHRTISALACKVDTPSLSRMLMDTTLETHPELVGESRSLLGKQFEFYIQHLRKEYEPLVRLDEDRNAVAIARDSLSKAGEPEKRYQQLLGGVRAQAKQLEVNASYAEVLTGNNGIPGEFTKEGRALFENAVSGGNFRIGDECVMGSLESSKSVVIGLDAQQQIRSFYYREYARTWREFLRSYKVKSFSSPKDAANKLAKLADTLKSPLLGIVKLVAINTKFEDKPSAPGLLEQGGQAVARSGRIPQPSSGLQKGIAIAKQTVAESGPPIMTADDVTRQFQPAWFTAPQQDILIDENNKAYVEGLQNLQRNIDNYDGALTADKPAALTAARTAAQQAKSAHQNLVAHFRSPAEEGTNTILSDLLYQPIDFASRTLPDPAGLVIGKRNVDLQRVCKDIESTLKKYPFNPDALEKDDATLEEIGRAFAPGQGKVWQYVRQSGAELVVRPGKEWVPNPAPPQGVRVEQKLIDFLNRAQQLTDALYSGGTPKFTYKLRPIQGYSSVGVIKLILDGADFDSSLTSLEKEFRWPGMSSGAEGSSGPRVSPGTSNLGKFGDLWGVFRLFQNADERPLGEHKVQWSKNRGLTGMAQPIVPPAKIEILELPGGADLFNPKFFKELRQCPPKAVSVN